VHARAHTSMALSQLRHHHPCLELGVTEHNVLIELIQLTVNILVKK
jgi:hypothetical protein